MKTPTQLRQWMAKNPSKIDDFEKELIGRSTSSTRLFLIHAINMLKIDVHELSQYRRNESEEINAETFKMWFPGYDATEILPWLDTERDYIYNSHGLRLIKRRYLQISPKTKLYEPIQYCMLRIARLFAPKDLKGNILDFDVWRLMYDAVSCGFMHTSSILSYADSADETIIPGEACRLIIPSENYDCTFIKNIERVNTLVSLGVGVGMSASMVPLNGNNAPGEIHSGFRSFTKKLESCNLMSMFERKPKVAIYIEMHNDTIYEAFELRRPTTNHLENVFVGIMVPDYFIECYKNDEMWHLFPSNATLDGKKLRELYGSDYTDLYKRFVKAKLYSKAVPSRQLMDSLVTCIAQSGSPYVIWSDTVNRYSNHKHLGKIHTLNLCAEITNYASVERSSSCTLMSLNFAMYRDNLDVFQRLVDYVAKFCQFDANNFNGLDDATQQFTNYPEMCKYAYTMGVIATLALNNFMGKERECRELGISPLGVYDMAVIDKADPVQIIEYVSEALYKGCVHASCKYAQLENVNCKYYEGSPFSYGIPQWSLRNECPTTDWSKTMDLMRLGMANSQLTAQAPTATTSMLVGVSESVTFPISLLMSRESENGRNGLMCYGILMRFINEPSEKLELNNSTDRQVAMYQFSAPHVDQSQSTMFSLTLNRQEILNLLMDTYEAKLKTGLYYTQPKQTNQTLTIVKHNLKRKPMPAAAAAAGNCQIDSSPICSKRRPSCDSCSG
ncbi:rr1 [Tomelloso virus]|uniref:Rr1 n=1 Tax=Tomelloso virus TaxID=2053981 RepID=A0A2H4T2M9_9VIRU|nr:rr1 [Tomelloso virus]ATY70181.1 rr1 [Tomelloso virus]